MFRTLSLVCLPALTACSGATPAPEVPASPVTAATGATGAGTALGALGARCGPDAACSPETQCVAVEIMPHTGEALRSCERPCATDTDCDALVPEAERPCVTAARTSTTDCQCTPGTPFVRCLAAAGDPQVRICDRRASFQDYGRPRCQ